MTITIKRKSMKKSSKKNIRVRKDYSQYNKTMIGGVNVSIDKYKELLKKAIPDNNKLFSFTAPNKKAAEDKLKEELDKLGKNNLYVNEDGAIGTINIVTIVEGKKKPVYAIVAKEKTDETLIMTKNIAEKKKIFNDLKSKLAGNTVIELIKAAEDAQKSKNYNIMRSIGRIIYNKVYMNDKGEIKSNDHPNRQQDEIDKEYLKERYLEDTDFIDKLDLFKIQLYKKLNKDTTNQLAQNLFNREYFTGIPRSPPPSSPPPTSTHTLEQLRDIKALEAVRRTIGLEQTPTKSIPAAATSTVQPVAAPRKVQPVAAPSTVQQPLAAPSKVQPVAAPRPLKKTGPPVAAPRTLKKTKTGPPVAAPRTKF